jgi:hypothetical protein
VKFLLLFLFAFILDLHSSEKHEFVSLPAECRNYLLDEAPLPESMRIDFSPEEVEEVGENISLGNTVEAFLPFPYRPLSPEQLRGTTFIHERFYTVLKEGVEPEFAIVGPLSPCIFVGIRNNVNGRAVIFHKMVVNSVASLTEIARQELGVTDSNAIHARVFANKLEGYEDPLRGIEGRSW